MKDKSDAAEYLKHTADHNQSKVRWNVGWHNADVGLRDQEVKRAGGYK